jgi:thiol-disulfide isomerase/thioredoxin
MRCSVFFFHQAALLLLLPLLLLLVQAAADADESGAVTLTTANFQEHVEDGHTWLVDFYAPWYEGPFLLLLLLLLATLFLLLLLLLLLLFPNSSSTLYTPLRRCGHCVKLNPVLDEVAAAVGDSLRIGKVRVCHVPSLSPSLPPSFGKDAERCRQCRLALATSLP